MANPKAAAVVQTALGLLDRQPPIPYVMSGETIQGLDCQGLVEYCVRQSGGKMSYSGSNDMIRNACTAVYTLAEARNRGLLKPGWLLFILARDGGEPAKYKADGIGNASHVGLYTGALKAEVVHASSSKGIVCASTLANAWTHCGPAKAIDYGEEAGTVPAINKTEMVVHANSGSTVRMRSMPSTSAVTLKNVPIGATVPVSSTQGDWAQIKFEGVAGWMLAEFLQTGAAHGPMADTVPCEEVVAAYKLLGKTLGIEEG